MCSVMQSDGNSFCGDVFMESDNMAYREENRILDQIYYKANTSGLKDLKFKTDWCVNAEN